MLGEIGKKSMSGKRVSVRQYPTRHPEAFRGCAQVVCNATTQQVNRLGQNTRASRVLMALDCGTTRGSRRGHTGVTYRGSPCHGLDAG